MGTRATLHMSLKGHEEMGLGITIGAAGIFVAIVAWLAKVKLSKNKQLYIYEKSAITSEALRGRF